MSESKTKEVSMISLSLQEFVDAAKRTAKRFIAWVHKKLTVFEDWLLKEIDTLGKKAEAKINTRLGFEEEPIVE